MCIGLPAIVPCSQPLKHGDRLHHHPWSVWHFGLGPASLLTFSDLSQDARIRYCSDSVEDILGYLPREVTNKSCWEYFHPDEIPFARAIQGRGISLDKAAVLTYARVKHKDGHWIACECAFTVVYDVLVATTAIYRRGPKARSTLGPCHCFDVLANGDVERALDGAGVRRIFSSSPRDPRYHMLQYLSNKFQQTPEIQGPEPRAALFLNRFSRSSTIMFATDGVSTILGLQPTEVVGKSFYYCIEENCLRDAVKAIESAKANDSIAYLRFWYRNPLQEDNVSHADSLGDEDEDGGVSLSNGVRAGSGSCVSMTDVPIPRQNGSEACYSDARSFRTAGGPSLNHANGTGTRPRTAFPGVHLDNRPRDEDLIAAALDSGLTTQRSSTDQSAGSADAVFDEAATHRSSSSGTPPEDPTIEIEAVVSCSSDGLVLVLRRARPIVTHTLGATEKPYYTNGFFAAPWATGPLPDPATYNATAAPPRTSESDSPATSSTEEPGFMAAIRDVAVFAWSLTGINGSLADYGRGTPSGEALPPDGLVVWDANANVDALTNERYNGFAGSAHRPWAGPGGEPSEERKDEEIGSSDDEVVWKRAPTMSTWRRPKRRAHGDAFSEDGHERGDGENQYGGRKRPTRSGSTSERASGSADTSGSGSGFASGTGSLSGSS